IKKFQDDGYGHYPVCVAKTQSSFSTDAAVRGAPSNHVVNVREVRLAAGAEFIVMICGDIMTMPGLPKVPSAVAIDVDDSGKITGLFCGKIRPLENPSACGRVLLFQGSGDRDRVSDAVPAARRPGRRRLARGGGRARG